MTLSEAQSKYLNQYCDVDWNWSENKKNNSKDDPHNFTRNVFVVEIYQNCHNELLFRSQNILTCPFRVERLSLSNH
jgi:hypothetical protein